MIINRFYNVLLLRIFAIGALCLVLTAQKQSLVAATLAESIAFSHYIEQLFPCSFIATKLQPTSPQASASVLSKMIDSLVNKP